MATKDFSEQLDYDMNERRAEFIARMQADGYHIVYPADNELQIDIDSDEHYAAFERSLEVVRRNWPHTLGVELEVVERPSKSGFPRKHVTVTVPFKLDSWQRIALQAALGSDPIRELLSATRLMAGDEHPTLFVELSERSNA